MSIASKLLASLFAIVLGWAAGFSFYVCYMTYFSPFGRPTDQEAILFWTGIFTFFGWIIFFVPLVLKVDEKSSIFDTWIFSLFGGVYALLVFDLLVGWWTGFWRSKLFCFYALVVGVVAGLVYSVVTRWLLSRISSNEKAM